MSVHLATVAIDAQSGLPEDRYVNTFHFEGGGTDYENIADMLDDFYNAVAPGNSASLTQQMPNELVGNNMTINVYDLDEPMPRVPLYTSVRSMISPSSGDGLPTEVALCLSYQAEQASGSPQARRRGRLYLGPFTEATNSGGRPALAIRQIICRQAKELLNASIASSSWQWVVYSRVDGVGRNVVGGWCDDSWDTQRRRGPETSSRVLWDTSIPA